MLAKILDGAAFILGLIGAVAAYYLARRENGDLRRRKRK